MTGWLRLTDQQRRTTIEQAAANSGINSKAIEKDWWVTFCLKAIFLTPSAQRLIFKGGTSLSKGWKLIERFSEDIDLALDPVAFGMESRPKPSHDYLRKLKKNGCAYTSTTFKKELAASLSQLGVPEGMLTITEEDVKSRLPDKDPQTIFVYYPSLYEKHPYFNDDVKIEVGVRSLKDPFEIVTIRSLLEEFFPNARYTEDPFTIPAAAAHKTFLEKIFLLHEKFAAGNMEKIVGDRQSRHLYDLFNIMEKDAGKTALKDADLYQQIIEHRQHHVHMKGVDYDHLFPSTVSFLPPDEWLEAFRKDYETMQAEMIYGDSPAFDEMMSRLKILLGRIRLMGETKTIEEIVDKALIDLAAVPKPYQDELNSYEVNISIESGNDVKKTKVFRVRLIRQGKDFVFDAIYQVE